MVWNNDCGDGVNVAGLEFDSIFWRFRGTHRSSTLRAFGECLSTDVSYVYVPSLGRRRPLFFYMHRASFGPTQSLETEAIGSDIKCRCGCTSSQWHQIHIPLCASRTIPRIPRPICLRECLSHLDCASCAYRKCFCHHIILGIGRFLDQPPPSIHNMPRPSSCLVSSSWKRLRCVSRGRGGLGGR